MAGTLLQKLQGSKGIVTPSWSCKVAGRRGRSHNRAIPTASSIVDARRSVEWYEAEQRNPRGTRHPARFHAKLMQFERQLDAWVDQRWQAVAQNRRLWKNARSGFVRRLNLPWVR